MAFGQLCGPILDVKSNSYAGSSSRIPTDPMGERRNRQFRQRFRSLRSCRPNPSGESGINSPIDIQGIPPETLPGIIEAATKDWRNLSDQQKKTIIDLSKRLDITENATRTLLRIVGEQDVPLERLSETLNRVATDYKRLQGQAAALNPDNATARDLITQ